MKSAALCSILISATALLVAACSGGGSDQGKAGSSGAFCEGFSSAPAPLQVSANCVDCSVQNASAAADGDLHTAAAIRTSGMASQITSFRGKGTTVYSAGLRAGAFLSNQQNALVQGHGLTLNTYLDGVPQESASGPLLELTDTVGGTGADYYASFETTLAFDSVELIVETSNVGAPSVDAIYELCGNGDVQL